MERRKLFLDQSYFRDSNDFFLIQEEDGLNQDTENDGNCCFDMRLATVPLEKFHILPVLSSCLYVFICAWEVWLDLWCNMPYVEHTESGDDKKESTLKTK